MKKNKVTLFLVFFSLQKILISQADAATLSQPDPTTQSVPKPILKKEKLNTNGGRSTSKKNVQFDERPAGPVDPKKTPSSQATLPPPPMIPIPQNQRQLDSTLQSPPISQSAPIVQPILQSNPARQEPSFAEPAPAPVPENQGQQPSAENTSSGMRNKRSGGNRNALQAERSQNKKESLNADEAERKQASEMTAFLSELEQMPLQKFIEIMKKKEQAMSYIDRVKDQNIGFYLKEMKETEDFIPSSLKPVHKEIQLKFVHFLEDYEKFFKQVNALFNPFAKAINEYLSAKKNPSKTPPKEEEVLSKEDRLKMIMYFQNFLKELSEKEKQINLFTEEYLAKTHAVKNFEGGLSTQKIVRTLDHDIAYISRAHAPDHRVRFFGLLEDFLNKKYPEDQKNPNSSRNYIKIISVLKRIIDMPAYWLSSMCHEQDEKINLNNNIIRNINQGAPIVIRSLDPVPMPLVCMASDAVVSTKGSFSLSNNQDPVAALLNEFFSTLLGRPLTLADKNDLQKSMILDDDKIDALATRMYQILAERLEKLIKESSGSVKEYWEDTLKDVLQRKPFGVLFSKMFLSNDYTTRFGTDEEKKYIIGKGEGLRETVRKPNGEMVLNEHGIPVTEERMKSVNDELLLHDLYELSAGREPKEEVAQQKRQPLQGGKI